MMYLTYQSGEDTGASAAKSPQNAGISRRFLPKKTRLEGLSRGL